MSKENPAPCRFKTALQKTLNIPDDTLSFFSEMLDVICTNEYGAARLGISVESYEKLLKGLEAREGFLDIRISHAEERSSSILVLHQGDPDPKIDQVLGRISSALSGENEGEEVIILHFFFRQDAPVEPAGSWMILRILLHQLLDSVQYIPEYKDIAALRYRGPTYYFQELQKAFYHVLDAVPQYKMVHIFVHGFGAETDYHLDSEEGERTMKFLKETVARYKEGLPVKVLLTPPLSKSMLESTDEKEKVLQPSVSCKWFKVY
ncbi:hypothetical protein P280DRAFT_472902, partial [Massarina eburnea CBS 473.64]